MRKTPRKLRALVTSGLAIGLALAVAGAARAVTPPSGGNWDELFNPFAASLSNSTTVCLDVPGGTLTAGQPLQMYHCHGYASNGAPQRWQFVQLSDGSYWIYNQSNLMCVTAKPRASAGVTTGLIEQLPCGRYDGQGWQLVPVLNSDTYFELESDSPTFNGACVLGGGYDHATTLWVPCSATDGNQIWQLG